MFDGKCKTYGTKNAVQKQGLDCVPGYGRRSWYQCVTCRSVTGMQKHPCDDKDYKQSFKLHFFPSF